MVHRGGFPWAHAVGSLGPLGEVQSMRGASHAISRLATHNPRDRNAPSALAPHLWMVWCQDRVTVTARIERESYETGRNGEYEDTSFSNSSSVPHAGLIDFLCLFFDSFFPHFLQS